MSTRGADRVAPRSPTNRPRNSFSLASSTAMVSSLMNGGATMGPTSFSPFAPATANGLQGKEDTISDMTVDVIRPVAASIDELLADATDRVPMKTSDSKSGAPFERVTIGGEP